MEILPRELWLLILRKLDRASRWRCGATCKRMLHYSWTLSAENRIWLVLRCADALERYLEMMPNIGQHLRCLSLEQDHSGSCDGAPSILTALEDLRSATLRVPIILAFTQLRRLSFRPRLRWVGHELMAGIGALSRLTQLRVNCASHQGFSARALLALPALRILRLPGGTLDEPALLTSLERLELARTPLTGLFPPMLTRLSLGLFEGFALSDGKTATFPPLLGRLDIHLPPHSRKPIYLSHLTTLHTLCLDFWMGRVHFPHSLTRLDFLDPTVISWVPVIGPHLITSLTCLTELHYVMHGWHGWQTPLALDYLTGFPHLTSLTLISHGSLHTLCSALAFLPRLRRLALYNRMMTESELVYLSQLPCLREFHESSPPTPAFIATIAQLHSLTALSLSAPLTRAHFSSPEQLSGLTRLRTLHLLGDNVIADGLLCYFPTQNMRELHLADKQTYTRADLARVLAREITPEA